MTALFDIKEKDGQHKEADKRAKAAISGSKNGGLIDRFRQVIKNNGAK